MKRHYYIGTDLNEMSHVEIELESAGISTPQIHVLSQDDAGVELARLNEVEAVLKKDVVHGTARGALLGILGSIAVLLLFWWSGLVAAYTWVPAIFLAVAVLGFCTWEGGLIGIQEPHTDFARFQNDLESGKHVLLVDVSPEQERILNCVIAEHPGLRPAGEGESTPGWVIGAQRKWSRFMELAP
jgi:hypothetical protein